MCWIPIVHYPLPLHVANCVVWYDTNQSQEKTQNDVLLCCGLFTSFKTVPHYSFSVCGKFFREMDKCTDNFINYSLRAELFWQIVKNLNSDIFTVAIHTLKTQILSISPKFSICKSLEPSLCLRAFFKHLTTKSLDICIFVVHNFNNGSRAIFECIAKFWVLPLVYSIHNGYTFSVFSIEFSSFHPQHTAEGKYQTVLRMIMAEYTKLAFIDSIQSKTFSTDDISFVNPGKNWRLTVADGK